jgi:hypothetical protein
MTDIGAILCGMMLGTAATIVTILVVQFLHRNDLKKLVT